MCPVKNDPQGQGSAITYMRRYALSAVLGIRTEEDDDGNAASNKGATIEVKNRQPERVKVSVGAAASLAAQKKRIIGLLSELGQGAKTKKQYEDAVFDLADLTLEKNNYPLIIDRLTDIVVTRMGEDRNIN